MHAGIWKQYTNLSIWVFGTLHCLELTWIYFLKNTGNWKGLLHPANVTVHLSLTSNLHHSGMRHLLLSICCKVIVVSDNSWIEESLTWDGITHLEEAAAIIVIYQNTSIEYELIPSLVNFLLITLDNYWWDTWLITSIELIYINTTIENAFVHLTTSFK